MISTVADATGRVGRRLSVGCTLSVGFTHGYIETAADAAKSTGETDADATGCVVRRFRGLHPFRGFHPRLHSNGR